MTPSDVAKSERQRVIEELILARDMAFGLVEYYGLCQAVELVESMHDADYSKIP